MPSFVVHTPARQNLPLAQSPSPVQPAHCVPEQVSPVQSTTFGPGQLALEPLQVSARVDCAGLPGVQLALRHGTLEPANPSAGHAELAPVQFSATSHTPAEARHTVALDAKPSLGHAVLEPVHVSATSHTPAEARHTVPALPAGCWQATFEPSH